MVFWSQLQKETLLLVDDLVNKDLTYDEIADELQKQDYLFVKTIRNGYASKNKVELYKNNEYSLVKLVRRRNGKASWESWKIS